MVFVSPLTIISLTTTVSQPLLQQLPKVYRHPCGSRGTGQQKPLTLTATIKSANIQISKTLELQTFAPLNIRRRDNFIQ